MEDQVADMMKNLRNVNGFELVTTSYTLLETCNVIIDYNIDIGCLAGKRYKLALYQRT